MSKRAERQAAQNPYIAGHSNPLQGTQIPCRAFKSLQTADIAVGSDAEGKALFDLLRQNKWVDLCLYERSRRNPRSRWIHVQWREEPWGRFVEEYWGDKQREWYRSWHKACRWYARSGCVKMK